MVDGSVNRERVFATGFTQVGLIALQTYLIAHQRFLWVFLIGFLISLVWCFNVRHATKGIANSLVYALGAACGSVFGLWFGTWLNS